MNREKLKLDNVNLIFLAFNIVTGIALCLKFIKVKKKEKMFIDSRCGCDDFDSFDSVFWDDELSDWNLKSTATATDWESKLEALKQESDFPDWEERV